MMAVLTMRIAVMGRFSSGPQAVRIGVPTDAFPEPRRASRSGDGQASGHKETGLQETHQNHVKLVEAFLLTHANSIVRQVEGW